MPDIVPPGKDDESVIRYRTSWLSALTGYHAHAKEYEQGNIGRAALFADLLKCDSVPTIVVTKDHQIKGGLPTNADLMVSRSNGVAYGQGTYDATFELIAPLTGMSYNVTTEAILLHVRFVILPTEGNLGNGSLYSGQIAPAAPADIANQLRGETPASPATKCTS
jgi:hypothetical protein